MFHLKLVLLVGIMFCCVVHAQADLMSNLKISPYGSSVVFSCVSPETPMWLRRKTTQSVMEGMALGDKKKSRFQDQR